MAWETRQERLRLLLGAGTKAFRNPDDILKPSPQLCFQVLVCCFPPESNDPKKYVAVCEKYGIDSEKEVLGGHAFQVRYGPLILPDGYVDVETDGEKVSYEPTVEALYTSTDPKIISRLLGDENAEEENFLYNEIVKLYKVAIERTIPGATLKKGYVELDTKLGLKFYFVIHPYKPELCAPEDIDVLKPITVVEGYEIHAAVDQVEGFVVQGSFNGVRLKPSPDGF